MHDHRIHADHLEQHHVARKTLLEQIVAHGVATVFDDDGFAVKALDVRQRLGNDLGFAGCGSGGYRHVLKCGM
ncbi:hypothetical protein D3C83_98940 [compost metagenome]